MEFTNKMCPQALTHSLITLYFIYVITLIMRISCHCRLRAVKVRGKGVGHGTFRYES